MKSNYNKSIVTFVSPHIPPSFGGGGRRIYNVAKYMASTGYHVSIITSTNGNRELIDNLELLIVKTIKPLSQNGLIWGINKMLQQAYSIYQLANFISKKRSSVIHIVGSRSGISIYSVIIAKFKGIKVINGTSGYGNDDPLTIKTFRLGSLRYFIHFVLPDIILNNSNLLVDSCVRAGVKHEKNRMIPNPVNTDMFSPSDNEEKNEIRRKFGLNQFENVVLTVSLIVPPKNIKEIIQIFKMISVENDSSILLIVGKVINCEVGYYRKLQELVSSLGLDDKVKFMGEVEDVREIMVASDCFVFASLKEGMPNVVLEAMSCGIPILMKRLEGVSDMMLGDGGGFEYTDLLDGQIKLRNILSDQNLANSLGRNARNTTLCKFSNDVVISQYIELYN